MKRLLVANKQKNSKSRYSFERMETIMQAQIDNLLSLGWQKENLILLTNFDFEFMGIQAEVIELNDFCLSGSKMWGLKWLFDNNRMNEVVYSADLDCWQNIWFDSPKFSSDVGACQYSNPKWNGGSIFWKPAARDIVDEIVKRLTETKMKNEEPTLNKVFKSDEYKGRITKLDHTYNVGCSGFIPRYSRSLKPIRVCHFQPLNTIAWEIHALDREEIGEIAVTIRLERLMRRYYPDLATKLSERKKKKIPKPEKLSEHEKKTQKPESIEKPTT